AIRWAREHRPDMILLDLMLPDVLGYTVCETLKLDRETTLIPVIMITALDDQKDRVHGFQVGAIRYLTKPFSWEELKKGILDGFAWREEIQRFPARGEIHISHQSDVQTLSEFTNMISSLLLHTPLSRQQVVGLSTALRELATNTIEWGIQKQQERSA